MSEIKTQCTTDCPQCWWAVGSDKWSLLGLAGPCTLVVCSMGQSCSWESLRHSAQLILSARAKTVRQRVPLLWHSRTVGTSIRGAGWRPPTCQLKCFHPAPSSQRNQCLTFSIHKIPRNTDLDVRICVKQERINQADFLPKHQISCKHWEKSI